ncbi:hypothetical protein H490_0111755 [Leucobacter sp. UCD-THU]|uniref:MFS transporter n=1 Tax=Leucobacter muris TaxID=1935379 RepID=A0ABX5QEY6_9MICO|nr:MULTISPECIES: MFS transporter [Leucobacter]EYT53078.1 hypothetical protein H490_0111755 [Leucobacter sp. UCD-THU]QAB17648.1 MFS transporter [Leucobacter muris]
MGDRERRDGRAEVGPLGGRNGSRRTAVEVNIAKLLLLAALAPLVVGGLAQRASALVGAAEAPRIVAVVVAVGALCAVVGALGFGALTDLVPRPGKWCWALIASVIGTLGLVLAAGEAVPALICGWGLAQFGYSGSMAVLRSMLASVAESYRRRGSVVMVMSGYLGALIPILLLIALPGSAWHITFGFAAAGVLLPLSVLLARRRAFLRAREDDPHARIAEAATQTASPEPRATPASASLRQARSLPGWTVLVVQVASTAVLAAFLTFHPLDLEHRLGVHGPDAVRSSALVLAAGLFGLLSVALLLFLRPRLFGTGAAALLLAAALLAGSIGARAFGITLGSLAIAALLTGAAVAVNASTLLVTALEGVPRHRAGRFIGAFSAAGALGQFVGPLLGLALLGAFRATDGGYTAMILVLGGLPAAWGAMILIVTAVPRRAARNAEPGRAVPGGGERYDGAHAHSRRH